MTPPSPADKIVLVGMKFYAYHGLNPEERVSGQPFEVDLEVGLNLGTAGITDMISDTISYSALYRIVEKEMNGPAKNLLEAVAHAIVTNVMGHYPATSVRIRLKKTKPPIKGASLDSAGIEIYRSRK